MYTFKSSLILLTFLSTLNFSQSVEKLSNNKKHAESSKNILPQAVPGSVYFLNNSGNPVFGINEEGSNGGSVQLPKMTSAPSHTDQKLYNIGGLLHFNGAALSTGPSVNLLGDLNDAVYDGSSLFLGNGAGANDGGSNDNTSVGSNSLNSNTSGSDNTAIGNHSLFLNTEGKFNSAFGKNSLYSNTFGDGNTAMGFEALNSNTEGDYNIAIGYQALNVNTFGDGNTAVGIISLNSNTTGSYNSSIGYYALYSNEDGDYNAANGYSALRANISGQKNTAIGDEALRYNTTGNFNVAVGSSSLITNITGSNNTALGFAAGPAFGVTDLTNTTCIGNGAIVSVSDKIRLGNDDVTIIEGKVDFTFTSDSTKKENFLKTDNQKILSKFKDFRLGSWNYIGDDPKTQRHYGIMAQDFFSAFGNDDFGTIGNDTTITGSDVNGINMIAIQALEKRTREQEQRIHDLEIQNEKLKRLYAEKNNIYSKLEQRLSILENLLDEKRFAKVSN